MLIRPGKINGTPTLAVSGEVDHSNGHELLEAGQAALKKHPENLFLDLSQCTYMDSGGISVILALLRQMPEKGVVGVVAPAASVRRVMTVVGLQNNPHFRVFETAEAAEAAAKTS